MFCISDQKGANAHRVSGWRATGSADGGEKEKEEEEEAQARVLCAKEESPITAAKSHDPIANSSMIHPAKNTRRGDRHETITRQTTSVTVFLRDRRVR